MKQGVSVTGIHLVAEGGDAVVRVEIDGRWVEVIREGLDGPFSHIVEPGGIEQAAAKPPELHRR
jgi:hypothetical protein